MSDTDHEHEAAVRAAWKRGYAYGATDAILAHDPILAVTADLLAPQLAAVASGDLPPELVEVIGERDLIVVRALRDVARVEAFGARMAWPLYAIERTLGAS